MTYHHSQINALDALYNAVRGTVGGLEAVAQRIGMRPQVLRNKLSATCSTHHISFEEAALLIEAMHEMGNKDAFNALHSLAWRLGHVAVPLPTHLDGTDDELLHAVCKSAQEHGEVMAAIGQSAADGVITARELEHIEVEAEESMRAFAQLRLLIKERARADGKGKK